MPQIEVTFDIDANGIVNCFRQGQGDEQGTEDHHPGLGRSVGRGHRTDGARGRRGERRSRQGPQATLVEAKNQGESLIHSTEKNLSEHGEKVDEGTRTAITAAVAELKEVLDGEDVEAIKAKSQALPRPR